MTMRPRRIERGSRSRPARDGRIAMLRRPLRVIRNRSRPFARRGCSSVAQYAMPALTVTDFIPQEFQALGCVAATTQRPRRFDGRPERLR